MADILTRLHSASRVTSLIRRIVVYQALKLLSSVKSYVSAGIPPNSALHVILGQVHPARCRLPGPVPSTAWPGSLGQGCCKRSGTFLQGMLLEGCRFCNQNDHPS